MTWDVIGWVVGAFVIVMAIFGFVRYHRWLQEIGRREDKRRAAERAHVSQARYEQRRWKEAEARTEAAERERDESLEAGQLMYDKFRDAQARVAALEAALRPFAKGKHVDKAGMDIARAALRVEGDAQGGSGRVSPTSAR